MLAPIKTIVIAVQIFYLKQFYDIKRETMIKVEIAKNFWRKAKMKTLSGDLY